MGLARFTAYAVLAGSILGARSAGAQGSGTASDTPADKDTATVADSATAADSGAGSASSATNYVQTLLLGLTISGYAEASYSYATENSGSTTVGRLFDHTHDEIALNALKLVLDRPYAADKFDAGFHADVLFGQNASMIQAAGLKLGDQGDIPQLFVTLNIPTANGNGFQFKAGKMVTLMGVEVIEDVVNPNWSEGYQFIFVENFTALGLSAEYKFNPHLDAQLRVTNGWDVVTDNNGRKSFMGRVGVYPDDKTSIGLVGYLGPEQAVDTTADRYGVNLVLNRKLGRASVWLQGDYGKEEANAALPDPTRDAEWWAVGGWLTYEFTPMIGVAFRGDYLDDRDGARTSGVLGFPANTGMKIGSGTATLNIRRWPNMLVRPEIRYDRSDLPAFDGKQDQFTFALSAAYLY
jgi:hypothetical protein